MGYRFGMKSIGLLLGIALAVYSEPSSSAQPPAESLGPSSNRSTSLANTGAVTREQIPRQLPRYLRGYSESAHKDLQFSEFVTARITTDGDVPFDVACEPGSMIYVTKEASGERFAYVVFPKIKEDNLPEDKKIQYEKVGQYWRLVDAEFSLREFELQARQYPGVVGDSVTERQVLDSVATGDEVPFPKSGIQLKIGDFLVQKYLSISGEPNLGSVCCVSCNGYNVCGCQVAACNSSCNGCGSGVPPLNKDQVPGG